MKTWIGIDNGVSGSIAIIGQDGHILYFATPVVNRLQYTKKKQWVNRVDVNRLRGILENIDDPQFASCVIERPMVNPGRFKATASALRCLEATLIILEERSIPYQFIDSKEWQKAMLPEGLQKDELKAASKDIASRLFPQVETKKDGDALLMAEYLRRKEALGQSEKVGGTR